MSLSVCLVTRNEEQNLPRVIGSVRGVADEVIVMDTNSADRSAAVAAEHGAKVFSHDWHDDFAAARNDALDRASGDWILWLNPDEELLPISRPTVEALLAQANALAYVVRVQELVKADQPDHVGQSVRLGQQRLDGRPGDRQQFLVRV